MLAEEKSRSHSMLLVGKYLQAKAQAAAKRGAEPTEQIARPQACDKAKVSGCFTE